MTKIKNKSYENLFFWHESEMASSFDVVNCVTSVAGVCCLQFHDHPIAAVCVFSSSALPHLKA